MTYIFAQDEPAALLCDEGEALDVTDAKCVAVESDEGKTGDADWSDEPGDESPDTTKDDDNVETPDTSKKDDQPEVGKKDDQPEVGKKDDVQTYQEPPVALRPVPVKTVAGQSGTNPRSPCQLARASWFLARTRVAHGSGSVGALSDYGTPPVDEESHLSSSGAPVVALDVDRSVVHHVTLHAEHWPAGQVGDDDAGRIPLLRPLSGETADVPLYIDAGTGPWVNVLLERGIEVVWATTWQEAANRYIAPLLSIPELPVATVWGRGSKVRFAELRDGDATGWKAANLKAACRGRPLAWLDDQAHRWAGKRAEWRPEPSLVIVPNPEVGITAEHRVTVDAWLEEVAR